MNAIGWPPTPQSSAQARILVHLRDHGPAARADLVDVVGLSRTAVAGEVDQLLRADRIEVAGPAPSRGGRPSVVLRLPPGDRVIGIDVGATSVDVALTDAELGVLATRSASVDVRIGPERVLNVVTELCQALQEEHPGRVLSAGVGLPGPVSASEGVLVAPPLMPSWDGYPVRENLSHALGVGVVVENDVNAMAVGEAYAGVAAGVADFIFVKVGTGIGCGVIVNGHVYHGASGAAGDIGHIMVERDGRLCSCGNTGCLEAYFGGAALARDGAVAADAGRCPPLAERARLHGAITAADVAAAAQQRDPVALALVRDGGRRLGQVIAGLVSFANPSLVVIGGGVAQVGHELLAEVRSVVYRQSARLATKNLPIVLSELAGAAGVVGAATLASDHALRR